MRNGAIRSPEDLFAEQRSEVRRLRNDDPVFDEICHDFELMAKVLREGKQNDEAVAESLDGLSEEIRRHLRARSTAE
ncbi:hypothetical protein CLV88_10527 [Shimia abyssi]|uniref:Uncharacterized protein n=2 Tax=Shimia abyssi TaxID=1662395 RepID=A0A2P8FD11_9RHOB|nr:hypothetical protein CLV88_10527 [Shimia abyssi]